MKYLKLIISILFLSVFVGRGFSQIITYNVSPTKDAELRSNSVSTNFGNDTSFLIGRTASTTRRGVVQFDLNSIPTNAIIYEAILKLNIISDSGDVTLNTARLSDNWYEDSITWSNQPDYESWDLETGSSIASGKLNVDLKEHVQRMVAGVHGNNGWILFSDDEFSTAANSYSVNSNESIITGSRPVLEIKYYLPIEVVSATIVHESGADESDGSVSPVLTNLSDSVTYQWYNSSGSVISTDSNLVDVSYGIYTLKVVCFDSASPFYYAFSFYYAFVIGLENEIIDISYKTNYTKNASYAYIANYYASGLGSDQNFSDANILLCGQLNTDLGWANVKSLLKFNVWIDSTLEINQADLTLYGLDHINDGRDNKAEFNLITEDWNKNTVTWNTTPNYTDSILVAVNETWDYSDNQTIDIVPYWSYWKENNTENNGILFQLEVYDEVGYAIQNYHSPTPAYDLDTLQPIIHFKFDLREQRMTWDTLTNTGTVSVYLYDIVDKTGPYRYIISMDSIPDLQDTYTFLNDSVFEGNLDSTSLLSIDDLAYAFTNLESGNYFVAVFDADFDRIVDEQILVHGDFTFSSDTSLAVIENEISATSSGAYGSLNLFTYDRKDSELQVQFDHYNGTQYIGYSSIDDSIVNSYHDLVYGFYAFHDTLYGVLNGNLSGTYNIVDSTDVLKIIVEDTILYLKINNSTILEKKLESTYAYKTELKLDLTAKIVFLPIRHIFSFPRYQVRAKVQQHPICDGTIGGSFEFVVNQWWLWFGSSSFDLYFEVKDETGATVESGTLSSYNGIPISVDQYSGGAPLLPGKYTISGTANGIPFPLSTITLGYEANWKHLVDYDLVPNTYSLKRTGNYSNPLSHAIANNKLEVNEIGWAEMDISLTNGSVEYLLFNNYDLIQINRNGSNYEFYTINPYSGLYDYLNAYPIGNSKLRIDFNSSNTEIRLNNTLITSHYIDMSVERGLAFKSEIQNDGFKNIITSFKCEEKDIYAKAERKLRGVRYKPYVNKVHFYMEEEYEKSTSDLNYNIYASLDRANPVLNGTIQAEPLPHNYGDNRYKIDVSSLALGAYILEVINEKNEKFYLRFIK